MTDALDRQLEFLEGLPIMAAFMRANSLPMPEFRDRRLARTRIGLYTGIVNVDTGKCRDASRDAFPRYVEDDTVLGTLAHELGHHLVRLRPFAWRPGRRAFNYEPNAEEARAESLRLFILNPDLLRAGRPDRFAQIPYTPSETRTWQEILAGTMVLEQARHWIEDQEAIARCTR